MQSTCIKQINTMTKLRLATKNSTKEERAAIDAEWAAAYPDQKAPPQKGRLVHEQPHEIAIA